MRFGASTFIWDSPFSTDTLDLIGKVHGFGFDIIEICVEDPDIIDTARTRRRLEQEGVGVSVCGAWGPDRDNSAEDAATRAQALAYTRRCIDVAAGEGANLVVGPMYAGVGATKMLEADARRAQWERSVEALTRLADYADSSGVRLALEPLNRFETDLVNTVDQGLAMLADVGHGNVGLLLDTFHMNIEEKDVAASLRRAGDDLFEFHACSSDRGTPGEDHLPWSGIAAALRETGYDGPVVIEAFTPKVKTIARAVSLWRKLAESEDALARNGLAHLRRVLG